MSELILNTKITPTLVFGTGIIVLVCLFIGKCIYNITLHPLSDIPGPRLAGMTSLYEFYWDVICDGVYIFQIQKMHAKYGPIVRINPNEIHIHDPEYYSTIYCGGTRRVEKDPSTVAAFSIPNSVAATVNHQLHRARRGYLNPYFSKRAIVGLESMIHERITKLCKRFEDAIGTGEIVCLDKAFSALTADIITTRLYGYNCDYLDIKDFVFPIRGAFLGVSLIFHIARFFPGPVKILKKLPIPVIRLVLPSVADFLEFQETMKTSITQSLATKSLTAQENKSVIIQALGDERIPSKERTLPRLLDEGIVIIFAGTETSSRALAVAMFYMLNNRALVTKLRSELNSLQNTPDSKLTLQELESLPFLTGVVQESFRLSFGPVSRLPRVAKDTALQYKKFLIPPGYPVSQSTYMIHTDPSVYPDPQAFSPERWVKAAEEGVMLNNFLVSFTKGSRQCLGIGMAYAELYLTLARVIHNFDMDLVDTTIEDVSIGHIRIVGYPKKARGNRTGHGEVTVKITGKTTNDI